MPKIARHHANDPWRPLLAWEEDAFVQWGRSGLVLRADKRGGCYGTAFFEAFPPRDSFIRGEGATLETAEAKAHAQWLKVSACRRSGGHSLSRGKYTNGAGVCRRCGGFVSEAFKPIVALGGHKTPLSASEISLISMGSAHPDGSAQPDDAARYARKLHLRARTQGVLLPDPRTCDNDDAYVNACERAVQIWRASSRAQGQGFGEAPKSLIEHFLAVMQP